MAPNSISIHALREEGDFEQLKQQAEGFAISIHALREEGDDLVYPITLPDVIISIHALREEGDCVPCRPPHLRRISIHALREEGDLWTVCDRRHPANFNPRPP